jgi:hypothetical protein
LIPAATLTDAEAQMIEQAMPANQVKSVGSRIQLLEQRTLHVQKVTVAADATAGQNFLAEVSGELVDVEAVCTASNAGGTLTVRRSSTAISSAIVCAVVSVPSRTALVLQASKAIVQGETLNIIANGAADRGIAYIYILRS